MQKSFCKTKLCIQYTRVLTIWTNPGCLVLYSNRLHPLITRIIAFQHIEAQHAEEFFISGKF